MTTNRHLRLGHMSQQRTNNGHIIMIIISAIYTYPKPTWLHGAYVTKLYNNNNMIIYDSNFLWPGRHEPTISLGYTYYCNMCKVYWRRAQRAHTQCHRKLVTYYKQPISWRMLYAAYPTPITRVLLLPTPLPTMLGRYIINYYYIIKRKKMYLFNLVSYSRCVDFR